MSRGARRRLDASAQRALEVRRRAPILHDGYRAHVRGLSEGGVDGSSGTRRPAGQQDFAVLDDHQVVNVAAMTDPEGYGMFSFDEQGAGKTVSVIYAFDRLVDLNLIDWMVVVAPKSMVGEWANAIRSSWAIGTALRSWRAPRAERVRRVDSGADVVVMNYEAVATVRDHLLLRLRRHPDRALLVVDESFAVKNPQARRTHDIASIRDWFGRAWLLCGTPAPEHRPRHRGPGEFGRLRRDLCASASPHRPRTGGFGGAPRSRRARHLPAQPQGRRAARPSRAGPLPA